MKAFSLALSLVLLLGVGAASAQDNTLFLSSNVNTGVTWHAPKTPGNGTSGSCVLTNGIVQYDSFPFFTDTTADTYSLHLFYESFQSGYVYLYQDDFDPQDPCVGIFVFGFAPLANISDIHLDANRQYFFVTSEDRLLIGGGSYQVTINGPEGSILQFGTAPSAAVTVSVAPVDPPVVIGPGGGSFDFTVTLANTTAQSQTIQAWTAATGPVDRDPVLGPVAVTLPAGATVTRTLAQVVPANAPPGTYTYSARVGAGGVVLSSDSFRFEKQGSTLAPVAAASGVWTVSGWEDAGTTASATELLGSFTLSAVAPNPFASWSRFTLDVTEEQHVTIEVLDALGRRVAVLHDGVLGLEAHTFTLDGTVLRSGAYVVRATGETFSATRRTVLMR